MAKVNWQKIKTEYVTTDISQHKLCEKHNIPYCTLKEHCRKEKWVEERKKHKRKVDDKVTKKIANQQAKELSKELEVANSLLKRLQELVNDAESIYNASALKEAATALKSITSTKRIIEGTYNQKERDAYDLAVRKLNMEEKKLNSETQTDDTIKLILPDEAKEWTV